MADPHTLQTVSFDEPAAKSPFIDPWLILRRRWKTVVLGICVGIWGGLVYYLANPPVYESKAQVLVIQKDPNLPAEGTDKGPALESNQFSNLMATHLQIVRSPFIVRQAVREQRLDLLPTFERVRKAEDPEGLWYVINNLESKVGDEESPDSEKGKVLQVTFRHSSPDECGAILKAVIASYERFVREKFHDVGNDAIRLLSQAQNEYSQELQREEQSYLEFLEKAPLMWRGDGGKSANLFQQRVQALETALSDVRLRHTEAKARLNVIESALSNASAELSEIGQLALLNEKEVARLNLLLAATKGDSNNEVFQSTQPNRAEAFRARYAQLLSLEAQEKALLTEFAEKHPRVLEVRESIRATKDFLDKNAPANEDLARRQLRPQEMVAAYVELLKHDVEDLEKREAELSTYTGKEAEAAKALLIYEMRGEAMHQEVMRKRALYEAVVGRLKQVSLIREFGGITTDVITPPEVGMEPKSYLPILLLLGAVLGGACGGGLAWVGEVRDARLRDPSDVRRETGLPILAHVLRFDSNGEPADRTESVQLAPQPLSDHPNSPAARAFRTLRAVLVQNPGMKVVEVASANSGDGKTTLVANLSSAVARAGSRVLVIDGDLQNPALHASLSLPNRAGLSDVIAGREALDDAIQHSSQPNLDVLSAGSITLPPGSWTGAPQLSEILRSVRERYDLVVFDTPASLVTADACELACRTDGVILVVNPELSERPQTRRATQILQRSGAHLVGVVVNSVYRHGPYECDELEEGKS
ncbi:MAG TPA: polysaccharide biosynthesis tyrosine autokinase [Planctomycetaceae bacterium]|nr:polysaccharide biosynthesis tyrosine autokinase [Planctomycetaceae bacterium]